MTALRLPLWQSIKQKLIQRTRKDLCSLAEVFLMLPTMQTPTTPNLPLFVSYAQIAIAKVPTTIRINPASAFLLNFSLNTK